MMPDPVEIEYNGEIIASMDSSGGKVLKTSGTIVEHDINVRYSATSGTPIDIPIRLAYSGETQLEVYTTVQGMPGEKASLDLSEVITGYEFAGIYLGYNSTSYDNLMLFPIDYNGENNHAYFPVIDLSEWELFFEESRGLRTPNCYIIDLTAQSTGGNPLA